MVKKIGLCPGQQLSTSITKIYQTCYNTSDNHYTTMFFVKLMHCTCLSRAVRMHMSPIQPYLSLCIHRM